MYGDDISLPLSWTDFGESPIQFANHFLVHHQPDEFVLTLSQLTGLPLAGTPDQISAQARDFGRLPIHTISRVALTRRRLVELIAILQARLEEHDELLGERRRERQPA
jgi:hypothetical protein